MQGKQMRRNLYLQAGALSFLLGGTLLYSTSNAADGDTPVVVKTGDSLSKIALAATGTPSDDVWLEIARYNDLDPDAPLVVGSTVLIPSAILSADSPAGASVSWTEVTDTPNSAAKPDTPDPVAEDLCDTSEVCLEESSTEQSQSVTDNIETATDNSPNSENSGNFAAQPDTERSSAALPGDKENSDNENAEPFVAENPAEATEEADVSDTEAQVQPTAPVAEDEQISQPAPGQPGLFDVDEDAAVRALERSLVQLDALLLDQGAVELSVDYSYAYDSTMVPVLISTSETDDTPGGIAIFEDQSTQQFLVFGIRYGLPGDSQISLSVPYEILNEQSIARIDGLSVDNDTQKLSNVGDYTIGFTKSLYYEKGRMPDILLDLSYDGDSGDESEDLRTGSGADEFTLGVNLTKRQDPLVFTASASTTISETVDTFKAGAVNRLAVGTLLAASPYTSLQFEFDQIFIGDASFEGDKIANSGGTIGTLTLGASSVLSQTLFLSAALRLGLTESATDYQFSMGLSISVD
jgi:hypothetical protein